MTIKQSRLERIIVPRKQHEDAIIPLLEVGEFVALLAPVRSGRSSFLRSLRLRLESDRPGRLFILLRPDQSSNLPRAVFLEDLLNKLQQQLANHGIQVTPRGADPYLQLKNLLATLPTLTSELVVVAVDDLGRIDHEHLHSLLWVFRELHSQRADEGWTGPLSRLAIIVAGSKRLYELTVGQDDQITSPFNVAELYHLTGLTDREVEAIVARAHQETLLPSPPDPGLTLALQSWVGGHPGHLKAMMRALIDLELLPAPAQLTAAAEQACADRGLLAMWERLQLRPVRVALAQQIFEENIHPPANFELATEVLQELYWSGWLREEAQAFLPRGKLLARFYRLHRGTREEESPATPRAQGQEPDSSPQDSSGGTALPATPRAQGGSGTPFAPALFPQGLLRALKDGSIVLFVGAGSSCAAGLPSWPKLTERMANRLMETARDEQDRRALNGYVQHENAAAVAQLARERIGAFEYHRLLTQLLRRSVPLAPIHHAMAQLPIRLILTTNFDKLLEKTFRTPEGDDPTVVVSTPQLAMISEEDGIQLIKLHGDIDQPDTIVLTSEDYRNYFQHHQALQRFLEHQFRYRTVLFLGFGLKDPNFDLIFNEARRLLADGGRPAYAVMVGANPIDVSLWRDRGLFILELQRYEDIPAYLRALTQQAKQPGPEPT